MAAPVRIEAEAFTDPRIVLLGQLCGYSQYEALGRLAHLWAYCTARGAYVVSPAIVDSIIGSNGSRAIVSAELGEHAESGIRVRGTSGRIEWLEKLRANSLRGGLANKRRLEAIRSNGESQTDSQLASQNGARAKPELSPLTLTLTPTRSKTPKVPTARARKTKPSDPTESELASVRIVLAKLGAKNGISYTGSPAHVQLIVGRLRDGYTEMDLRKVIAYCAEQWRDSKMAAYLRPETLFGPTTITRYADAARAWFETLNSEERAG